MPQPIFKSREFSEDIRVKRAKFNTGVREVGKMIGVSATTVSRLENENIPDLITYFKVCKWLGKPVEGYIKHYKF